jgi:tRNA (adenine57-N1/adenine58-N1)-methyltransferase
MNSLHAKVGELVQLIGPDDKAFFVRLAAGQSLHTHYGILKHDAIIGQPFGKAVLTHQGKPYLLLQLSTYDQIMHVKRASAIVYPKETGYILLKLGVKNGTRLIEAGTGSGALTLAFATAVQPAGMIYTYEERGDMQQLARKNLDNVGVLPYVTMKQRNIGEGFDETDADALFLDVREPQDFLLQAHHALKGGGFFGSIVPTANQVSALLTGLQKGGWIQIEVQEFLQRSYKIVPERLRPDDRMVGHTGYLIFARKVDALAQTQNNVAEETDAPTIVVAPTADVQMEGQEALGEQPQ